MSINSCTTLIAALRDTQLLDPEQLAAADGAKAVGVEELAGELVQRGCPCSWACFAVGAFVRRLMAKKPADRYQTPAELAEALTSFAVPADTAPAVLSGRASESDSPTETSCGPPVQSVLDQHWVALTLSALAAAVAVARFVS